MCKVFGVTGVNNKNRMAIIQIMKEITPLMTKVEVDGVGYAAIDKQGQVFGEKWVNPKDAWKKRKTPISKTITDLDKPIIEQFSDVIGWRYDSSESDSPSVYEKFGNGKIKEAVAFILHSRWSTGGTNSVNIQNTHPFVKNGTAMIHNGIVYNEQDFKKETTTCDSEILLNQYETYNVNMDSRALTDALKDVQAYFACLMLSQTMTDKEELVPILDVFVNGATLKVIHVHDLNANFFVTNAQDLISVCKKKGLTVSRAFEVNDDVLIRINAETGLVMEKQDFNYDSDKKWSDMVSEDYLKSRYGEDWKMYDYGDDGVPTSSRTVELVEGDLDAPAYRNEPKLLVGNSGEVASFDDGEVDERDTLYDDTRFPYKSEMEIFRTNAESKSFREMHGLVHHHDRRTKY